MIRELLVAVEVEKGEHHPRGLDQLLVETLELAAAAPLHLSFHVFDELVVLVAGYLGVLRIAAAQFGYFTEEETALGVEVFLALVPCEIGRDELLVHLRHLVVSQLAFGRDAAYVCACKDRHEGRQQHTSATHRARWIRSPAHGYKKKAICPRRGGG